MRIVLLSGKQGSGKTSLQRSLAESWYKRHGQGATCLNFADVLYEMHDAVLGILHKYYPRREIVKDGPLLQVLGTDWARKTIDTNIWVKILQKKAELWNRDNPNGLLIVGDCRFENEFEAVPDALRVRLECSREVRKARCSMWRDNDEHASETGLDGYAAFGKFDMYVDTEHVDSAGATSLLVVALEKNDWMNRREK